ncbi:MAG: 4Fe-4S dicluster domain-containing protein [Endomicrobiia bacterium]
MRVLTKKFKIVIETQYCKGCQFCIETCPQGVLGLSEKINKLGYRYVEVINPQNCTGCGRCYIMCPDYLIEIFEEK